MEEEKKHCSLDVRRLHGDAGGFEKGDDGEDEDDPEDEDESRCGGAVGERDMNSFQKTIPALRRHDPKTSTIRQHYYPEGGWGWVICGCVFLIHILTTGMQYSYGVLYTDLVSHVSLTGQHSAVTASESRVTRQPRHRPLLLSDEHVHYCPLGWVGSTSLAVSRCVAPLVVALCRRKSTRLTAVMGGLIMALATLFASFALQLHQVFLRSLRFFVG
ncbi:Major facilitator superfamily domain [Trinorchestia longiramus]|nr:Major facilitator superfamily domain [Trinorchestia longiramus]